MHKLKMELEDIENDLKDAYNLVVLNRQKDVHKQDALVYRYKNLEESEKKKLTSVDSLIFSAQT